MKTKKIKKEQPNKEQVIKKLLLFQKQIHSKIEFLIVGILIIISISLSVYYLTSQYQKNSFFSFPLDDPWIHLQFAKNLIEYGSYSYFKNEVITSGSTSPLYTFLAAFLFLFIKNEFILSYIIGILFLGLLVFSAYKLAKLEFQYSIGALVFALLISIQPKISLISVSGMETTMFIFFLISTIYFYRKENFLLTGIFSGLTLWTRPEGLILIGALILDLLLQRNFFKIEFASRFLYKKQVLRFLLPLILISSVYFFFNYLLSGTPFPNTYQAKIAYYFGSDRLKFLKVDVFEYFTSKEFILISFFFLVGVAFLVRDVIKKQYNSNLLHFIFLFTFLLAYYVQLPISHRFGRYLMPVIPFYILISIDGLHRLFNLLQTKSKTDQRLILNFFYVIILVTNISLSIPEIKQNEKDITFLGKYHFDRHIRIGEWLKQNTKESDIIATHDIGAIAFYSDRKIIDMVGLVNPEIIDYLRDKNSTTFLKEHFLRNNVTYFATMRNWFEAVNQNPVFIPVNEFEFFEVFKFEPEKFHIMPKEASEYNQRAIFLIQNQNFRGALDFLMRSLRIDPKSSRTLFLIGNVYDFLQDYNNAEIYLKRALEIFPDYPEARYELARIYFIKQNYQLAKEELLKAIQIKPDFKEAIQFVITILENVDKNFEEAKKYRETLSKL